MSRLNELIAKLCPDGVEYKRLGDNSKLYAGATPRTTKREYWDNGTIPWMSSGEVNLDQVYCTEKKISKLGYDKCSTTIVPEDTVVIALAGQGKTRGMVAITRISLCTNQSLCSIVPCDKLNSYYLYYYLKTQYNKLRQISSGDGTRGGLNMKMINNFEIPIPPLPIQKEIVRILDKFTMLEAELEAELENRRKQYEWYRDSLLNFGDDFMNNNLGSVCSFVRGPFGGSLKKECFVSEGYALYEQQHAIYGDFRFRYFVTEQKYSEMERFSIKSGDLIMSCSGTMGKISIIPKNAEKGIINQALLKLTVGDRINNKFLKYYFESTAFMNSLNSRTRGGAIKNVASVAVLKKIQVPLPPLAEQERIVAILDRFDMLVNDITQGLPAEIEARRKQYEYYRDKLLTFKPAI